MSSFPEVSTSDPQSLEDAFSKNSHNLDLARIQLYVNKQSVANLRSRHKPVASRHLHIGRFVFINVSWNEIKCVSYIEQSISFNMSILLKGHLVKHERLLSLDSSQDIEDHQNKVQKHAQRRLSSRHYLIMYAVAAEVNGQA